MRQIVQAQIAQAKPAAQGARGSASPAAPPQEDEQVKADRKDLRKLYKGLAAARKPVRTVSEYIYASLPGWCARRPSTFPLPTTATAGTLARWIPRPTPDRTPDRFIQPGSGWKSRRRPFGADRYPVWPEGNGLGQSGRWAELPPAVASDGAACPARATGDPAAWKTAGRRLLGFRGNAVRSGTMICNSRYDTTRWPFLWESASKIIGDWATGGCGYRKLSVC